MKWAFFILAAAFTALDAWAISFLRSHAGKQFLLSEPTRHVHEIVDGAIKFTVVTIILDIITVLVFLGR